MPAANQNCTTCHGQGQTGGCPDCHGTSPAVSTPPSPRRWPKFLGALLGAGVLAGLAILGIQSCNGKSASSETAAAPGTSAPKAPDSGVNTDPLKPPPAPSATAVAGSSPDSCGDGTVWDATAKKCVGKAPPIPSAIAITVTPGCPPTDCPNAKAPPVASASAPPPASSGKGPPSKPVLASTKIDLTEIGNPAMFPQGQ